MQANAKCSTCGGRSPADALFCIECGESLVSSTGPTTRLALQTCRSCGAENTEAGNFCSMCGQPLGEPGGVGLPWTPVQTPSHSRAHSRPAVPGSGSRPAPTVSYPRVSSVPSSSAHSPSKAAPASGGVSLAIALLIVGAVVLVIFKLFTMPFILVLLALAFFVHQAEHGRAEQALRTLLTIGALIFVLANPKFWPALLLVFIGAKMLGR